jgi:uncharacterized protein YggE
MAIATSSLLLTQASSTAQQIFYPSSQDPNAVMVTGMGMAKAAADSAELYFYLGSDGPFPAAVPPKSRKPPAKPPQPAVSEKSIVDALVAIGIPASAIRVDADRGAPIYGPPNARETLISVKLEKPTRQRVRQVVNIVRANAYKAGQSPRSTYAAYRSTNCSALEKAAYAAAVQEAKTKAGAIAESMGVTLVTTPSISEAFFGIFYPPCDPDKTFPFNPGSSRPNYLPYNPDSEPEVVLRKDIYATFRITPSK